MIYIRLLPFAVLAIPGALAGHVRKSDLAATAPASSKDKGCFVDDVKKRILSDAVLVADNMTIETCASYCNTYLYAGLEYGKECYCGNTFDKQPGNLKDCNQPCAGNPSQSCGAGNRLRVYFNPPPTASTPDNVGKGGKWKYIGCYEDQVSSRRLPAGTNVDGGMTAEKCTAACETGNYTLAGLEYAKECWCGNTLSGASPTGEGSCDTVCSGNSTQLCGGSDCLTVFQVLIPTPDVATHPADSVEKDGKWQPIGCYEDNVKARVLPGGTNIDGGMTAEKCITACEAGNYTLAGLEYAKECWCGNDISNASLANDGGCNMACTGDSTQTCGGGNRLTVFQVPSSAPDVGTTCVETDTKYSFNLKAVRTNGSDSLLVVVHAEKDVYIVTNCSSCPTPYVWQTLIHGQLYAEHAENTSATAVSSSVNKGDMVKFKHESQETETKYCMVNNPDDDNTIFLAVNGLRNQWAMCSNTKAAGRFELVWAPIKGHKDYSYDTCQSIILVAEKCEDPDEDGEVEGDYEGDEDDYEGDGGKEAEGNKEDEGDKEDEETMEEATN